MGSPAGRCCFRTPLRRLFPLKAALPGAVPPFTPGPSLQQMDRFLAPNLTPAAPPVSKQLALPGTLTQLQPGGAPSLPPPLPGSPFGLHFLGLSQI